MLIRSQNRKTLVNLENVTIGICNKYEVAAFRDINAKYYVPLGTYSTEENAIKVLDIIQQCYSSMELYKAGDTNLEDIAEYMENVGGDFDVFQMPQDEEVEV